MCDTSKVPAMEEDSEKVKADVLMEAQKGMQEVTTERGLEDMECKLSTALEAERIHGRA